MKVYIILEHPDGMGGTAKNVDDVVHGVFLTREATERHMRGMISYINSYEAQKLFFVDGEIKDKRDTVYFQVVERDIIQ